MSNDVIDFTSRQPPRKPALNMDEPIIPSGLKAALEEFISFDGVYYVTRAEDLADAKIVETALLDLCMPADAEDMRAWLKKLLLAVSNPPTDDQFAIRLAGVCASMCDLPKGVWTLETLARAMKTFRFWPSVAELSELLEPVGATLRRRYRNAKRIAGGQVRYPLRPVSPEQERAYIQDIAEARRQRKESEGPKAGVVPTPAEPLTEIPSNDQLIAKYEQVAATARDPALVEQAKEILAILKAPSYAQLATQQLRELAEKRGLARPSGDASPALAPKESPAPEAGQAPTGA